MHTTQVATREASAATPGNTYASLLSLMDSVLPWKKLNALARIQGSGFPAARTETLLRIYLVQEWFGLSDDATEAALHDSISIRAFVRLDALYGDPPDLSVIRRFRQQLNSWEGRPSIRSTVDQYLLANRYFVRNGSRLEPVLVRYDQQSGLLGPLAEQFQRMSTPYQLADILRFNAIYRQVYSELNPAERQRAEQFVDRLIDGVACRSYVSRIFGVV
jgi:transposase